MRIRQGNDFIFLWAIERNGLPENFSNAENIRLHFKNFDCVGEVKSFQIVDGNIVRVEVSPEWASRLGAYRLILSYEFENNSYSDGDRKCVVDVLAFNIVPKTSEADDITEMAKTTDIMIGLKGDKGDKGDPFTYEDFTQQQLDAIQQPITDFVAVAEVAENQREINEGERVQADLSREQRTNTAIQAVENAQIESEEVIFEALNDINTRVEGIEDAEVIREQQEQARQTNTATAVTNAENAITDVNAAKDDYYDVVKPEILQAIDDANDVVDRLEGAVSFTVKTRDEYNQITPKVADKIYVTKPTLLIPSAEEKQGFAFKGEDVIFPNYASKENLVLHYDFSGMKNSDVTKAVARDLSGNGNNATLNGFGYIAGSGYENGGLQFDKVDDYIVSNNPITMDNSKLTIEITHLSGISGFLLSTKNYEEGFYIRKISDITWRIRGDGLNTESVVLPKIKHKLTIVYNGADRKIYVNGNPHQTMTIITPVIQTELVNLFAGKGVTDNKRYYLMDGLTNNVFIYNKALTSEEVAQNYEIDKKRFNITE